MHPKSLVWKFETTSPVSRHAVASGLGTASLTVAEATAQERRNTPSISPLGHLRITRLEIPIVQPLWLFLKVLLTQGMTLGQESLDEPFNVSNVYVASARSGAS
jgi:hypothetical protein